MTSPQPVGALHLWHEELRRRLYAQDPARPSTWRTDALYRAACCDANGVDALRSGLPGHAAHWFARAATIIEDSASARQGAA